jgi:hypothetical protein
MKAFPLLLLGAVSANFAISAELTPPLEKPERPATQRDHFPPPSDRAHPEQRMPGPSRPLIPRREKVTHLGIGVAPAGPSLAAQLGLAPHTGLVVTEVSPKSPAHEQIKTHDVLLDLDGQLLINPEQFTVLIRNHRAGDEVTLKLIRGGKAETIRVKLTTQEISIDPRGPRPMPAHPAVNFRGGIPIPGQPPLIERQTEVNRRDFPSAENTIQERRVVIRDQAGSIELNTNDQGRKVIVKDADGKTLFSGPLNSPADFEAAPASIKPHLQKLKQARGPMEPDGRP